MLNWLSVFFTFLWILGLAGLLATVSFVHWQAGQEGQALLPALSRPPVRLLFAAGFGLVALGQSLSAVANWAIVGWAGLLLLALWTGVSAWRDGRDQDGQR